MVLQYFNLHVFDAALGWKRSTVRTRWRRVCAYVCVIHLHLAFAVRETLQSRELALLLGSVEKV